ncbi:MAG: UDP-N-acetylglucosamine 2-epimerase (non-hydrolyzing) [Pelagibacteraceae bacterium]|nr:UDP-N-acetylglucosamine 2-epimerase (non-hydrolyzing) [Pelagibacteraceae bacterium]|tara:strand:+ start:4939 stop:6075 length:1137 start_codon:yes stop_codon:yes gene_type:complete
MKNLKRKSICFVIGTRPELIKQLPVYYECVKIFGKAKTLLINSGQHRNFLDFYIKEKNIKFDLTVKKNESTSSLKKNLLNSIDNFFKIFKRIMPKMVVVQGDTTTAAGCAYAAFLNNITVVHNEAGLRTYNNKHPYPEELNRRFITSFSDIHLAPTLTNKNNLINEGIDKRNIFVVGNPGIDNFLKTLKEKDSKEFQRIISKKNKEFKKIIFLTAHRREGVGKSFKNLFSLLKIFLKKNKDILLITTLHPNCYALRDFKKNLKNLENVYTSKPFDYLTTCKIIESSSFVITDSGGIQEECATIGIPTVICRNTTERIEAIKVGIAKLTKFNNQNLTNTLIWARKKKNNKIWKSKPYGDGNASSKIVKVLKNHLNPISN